MHRLMTTLLLGAAFVLPVLAQEGGVPPPLVDHWKTSKKYLLALAEQMPADGYAFKPNPAEMSFGEQAIALTTYGMPLVVEIGIFFDVVVAVMVLGILVFRIRESFDSMDVSKLNELKW